MRHTAPGHRIAPALAVAGCPLAGRRRFGEPPRPGEVVLNDSAADPEPSRQSASRSRRTPPCGPIHVKHLARHESRSGMSVWTSA